MDWFELIIFAIVVFFGLLAGDKKKKKKPRAQQSRPHTRPAPSRPRETAPPRADDSRIIAERILEQMRVQEEQARAEREASLEPLHTSEAVSLETERAEVFERAVPARDAYGREVDSERDASLETLEPAGAASHERFHELYITPLADVPPPGVSRPRFRSTLSQARDAFVLMAVFGPPKGLD